VRKRGEDNLGKVWVLRREGKVTDELYSDALPVDCRGWGGEINVIKEA
jgi:hypothetical protein